MNKKKKKKDDDGRDVILPARVPDYVTKDRTTLWINVRNLITHNGQGRCRKLTLDDFPMDHGVKDTLQRAMTSRQEKSKLQDRLMSARQESESLRDYSRRRFQTVVDWETRQTPPLQSVQQPSKAPPVPPIAITKRPKTTSTTSSRTRPHSLISQPPPTPTTPTNGPTKDGSVLYNGKPLLLSSIRTHRPSSEPPSRFDHLRGAHGKNYPYIQRTLEQSNCEYRVGGDQSSQAANPQRSDGGAPLSSDFVMLIPVTPDETNVIIADDEVGSNGSNEMLGMGMASVRRKKGGQAWTEEERVREDDVEGRGGGSPLLTSTARSGSPGELQEREIYEVTGQDQGQGQAERHRTVTNRERHQSTVQPRSQLASQSTIPALPSIHLTAGQLTGQ